MLPFVNGDELFFRMTNVSLPVRPRPIPFLAQSEEFFAIEDRTLRIDASRPPIPIAEELVFVHAAEMFGVAKVEGE